MSTTHRNTVAAVFHFPWSTRSHRFKKCTDYKPKAELRPAPFIVTTLGHRTVRQRRSELREQRQNEVEAARRARRRMLSKVIHYRKTWQTEENGQLLEPELLLTTVWHRYVCAAKLILECGEF